MLTSSEIRKQFIDFFKSKEHTFIKSSPVVPQGDPTLLFINAGMNQFKNIFLGIEKPKCSRAVNSQKCIRAGGKHNDLDEVGKDGYHHTFFEMLGNWSFGDYYKKEIIKWSWELITEVWKLDKDKLYASVHNTDQEAYELWKEITDIDPTHISYHGDKDNFWEMGETGPCGPCSEIHYDRGTDFCGVEGEHNCTVNGDCHRYMEIWNLVFMQYYREKNGSLTPLKTRHIDTGMGFERICQLLQNKKSNYETDLFLPIIEKISELSGIEYHAEHSIAHRVIADHIRCLTFSLADGGMPSNEGAGYVLRRILRRAARFGRKLNLTKPFLYKLVDTVIEIMGNHFDEIIDKRDYIIMIIKAEEERFNQTLDKGLDRFAEIVSSLKGNVISGKDAFMLYDTFGFPIDLTQIMAEEKDLSVDMDGFNLAMNEQKERARSASKFTLSVDDTEWNIVSDQEITEFVGYNSLESQAKIVRYALADKGIVKVVLDKTPFYAEMGGQAGDKGVISNDDFKLNIFDVKKIGPLWVHFGKLDDKNCEFMPNNIEVVATVDKNIRKDSASNHSATHLLHAALRKVLGNHVQQKGSYVDKSTLRFDFTHFNGMNKDEIAKVEELVNREIRANLPVITEVKSADDAKKSGAMALFGEKYGDSVRVVTMGDFSMELCGGTHVKATGEIGAFKIISEFSSAAGIRRIEAVTGKSYLDFVNKLETKFANIKVLLNANDKNIEDKINKLHEENKRLQNELEELKAQQGSKLIDELIASAKTIADTKVVIHKTKDVNSGDLRTLGDQLKDKLGTGVGIIFSDNGGKVSILTVVTKDLTKRYHAGKIVGKLATIVGGKGGGRPDSAMAGGKDATKIDEAINIIPEMML